jgi:NAD(P)H dehydrogenase (quinone)
MSVNVHVIFYSMYGHVFKMAEAVASGARTVQSAEVKLFPIPELVPEEILLKSGASKEPEAFAHIPIAKLEDLENADALIFGTPTRFGNMCAQMRNFLDQDWRLVGARCTGWKDRQRIHQHWLTAWRSGNHHHQFS